MGWDAFAYLPGGKSLREGYFRGELTDEGFDPQANLVWEISDPKLRARWQRAAEEVISLAGGVDWMVRVAGLDSWAAQAALSQATGQSCFQDWSPKTVRRLHAAADWSWEPEDRVAYWSARIFLQVYAELRLGVYFSY